MSLDLICPNCGASVGEADSSNGYKEVYYKSDDKGRPECPNCGAGESMANFERNLYIGMIIFAVSISILAAVL